jgi:hypothetical protein
MNPRASSFKTALGALMTVPVIVIGVLMLGDIGGGGGNAPAVAAVAGANGGANGGEDGATRRGTVKCAESGSYAGDYHSAGRMTASWSWSCTGTTRTLLANGLPDHEVGVFPNAGNPNMIRAQEVSLSLPLFPVVAASVARAGPMLPVGYSLAGVKFDPVTNGHCPGTAVGREDCSLDGPVGHWLIEALGQSVFDFGVDANNAHVQPSGAYHYHGMPEALLARAGLSDKQPAMLLVGWASDGYPIYARYCYRRADDAGSGLKRCAGSYQINPHSAPDRPSTHWAPLGTFDGDHVYVAGSGDLDDCNGRTGVTPEFPHGTYYYILTDSYPYIGRCLKGKLS